MQRTSAFGLSTCLTSVMQRRRPSCSALRRPSCGSSRRLTSQHASLSIVRPLRKIDGPVLSTECRAPRGTSFANGATGEWPRHPSGSHSSRLSCIFLQRFFFSRSRRVWHRRRGTPAATCYQCKSGASHRLHAVRLALLRHRVSMSSNSCISTVSSITPQCSPGGPSTWS